MDFPAVDRELCAETAGGESIGFFDKAAAEGGKRSREKSSREKSRYWGSVLFYKHLILGMTAFAVLVPLIALAGMVYKYSCLKAEYQGLLHRADAVGAVQPAEKESRISGSGQKIREARLAWNEGVGIIPFPVNTEDWNYILVNDWNPLPASYKLQLDVLKDGHQVDYRIAEDLEKLLSDAKAEEMDLLVCSAYRSYERQADLFNSSVEELLGQGMTYNEAYYKTHEQYAVVSYSEHHTGLAVDIVGKSHQLLDERQGRTKEAQWLAENCARYGFILRYPKGKEKITGIEYESWHFRYVGKEAAAFMMKKGLTLEEFLKIVKLQQKTETGQKLCEVRK